MAIDFTTQRWQTVKDNYEKWWNAELERPLIQASVNGRNPGRAASDLPFQHLTALYDLDVSAEEIVDSWDYQLSQITYLGDSFPEVFPNFGAGVMAALLGCRLEARRDGGNVWFHPPCEQAIREIDLAYDADNVWFKRIREVLQAAVDRWQGSVQVNMTDLGGNLDVLSSFRPSEQLLLDLYDDPDHVKRVTWQVHELWQQYFAEFNAILQPTNPGYTAWAPILSQKSSYMLQCDFCYMISPQMFDEFVKPELAATCQKLERPFYHLDGPGELPHLDSMLEIEALKGIQWIPGSGSPAITQWPEVFRKIRAAGKLVQIFATIEEFEVIADQVGSAEGFIVIWPTQDIEKKEEIMAGLEKFAIV